MRGAAVKCMYCGSAKRELRPYGIGGGWSCAPCAMETTPERRRAAEAAMAKALDGAGDKPVSFGDRGIVAIESLTAAELAELTCTHCLRTGGMTPLGCALCGAAVGEP